MSGLTPEFCDSLVIKVDITVLKVVNTKYPDTFLTVSQISCQNVFPGICPVKRVLFLLPGNFLASGRYGFEIVLSSSL